MLENLDKAKAEIMAEPIIMALVDNGMGRQDAHELVRQLSMRANKTGKTLGDLLKADKKVKKHLTVKDVEAAVDPRNYLGVAGEIVDAAVKVCKEIR
jgi:adenylosuccinate lyase